MKTQRMKLLENKLRKMVREELMENSNDLESIHLQFGQKLHSAFDAYSNAIYKYATRRKGNIANIGDFEHLISQSEKSLEDSIKILKSIK